MIRVTENIYLEGTKEERDKQEADLLAIPPHEITHTTNLYNSPNTTLTVDYWHTPGTNKSIQKWIAKRVHNQLSTTHPHYSHPFGTKLGFHTNLGTVQPPDEPVKGYIFTEDTGWVLHATPA